LAGRNWNERNIERRAGGGQEAAPVSPCWIELNTHRRDLCWQEAWSSLHKFMASWIVHPQSSAWGFCWLGHEAAPYFQLKELEVSEPTKVKFISELVELWYLIFWSEWTDSLEFLPTEYYATRKSGFITKLLFGLKWNVCLLNIMAQK